MNCRGTAPPTTLSTNSMPEPRGQRLHLDLADRELPVPAGLLHMAAAPRRPAGERLPQGDLVRYDVDLDAVPVAQPFQGDVRVRLAQAPQDHLVGVLVLFQPHGRVLGDQPGQALRELVLVRLAVRLDGERQQRVGHLPRLHQQRVVLGREGVAGLRAAQLRHARQVAGDAVGEGALLLAERARTGRRPARRRRGPRGRGRRGRARRRAPSRRGAGCRRRRGRARPGRRTGRRPS